MYSTVRCIVVRVSAVAALSLLGWWKTCAGIVVLPGGGEERGGEATSGGEASGYGGRSAQQPTGSDGDLVAPYLLYCPC